MSPSKNKVIIIIIIIIIITHLHIYYCEVIANQHTVKYMYELYR